MAIPSTGLGRAGFAPPAQQGCDGRARGVSAAVGGAQTGLGSTMGLIAADAVSVRHLFALREASCSCRVAAFVDRGGAFPDLRPPPSPEFRLLRPLLFWGCPCIAPCPPSISCSRLPVPPPSARCRTPPLVSIAIEASHGIGRGRGLWYPWLWLAHWSPYQS